MVEDNPEDVWARVDPAIVKLHGGAWVAAGSGQRPVEEILADPLTEPGSLEFRTEDLPADPAVRIEYREVSNPGRWVCEYVVVRGSPESSSNLGYSIELSGSSSEPKTELEAIASSFALLGVEP